MSDTQTPYTGSNYTAPVDAVYDPPGTLTSGTVYCPECAKHAALMRNLREWLASFVSDDDTGFSDALAVIAWLDAWEGKR